VGREPLKEGSTFVQTNFGKILTTLWGRWFLDRGGWTFES